MNYSRQSLLEKQYTLKSSHSRTMSKFRVLIFRLGLLLFVALMCIGVASGIGVLKGLIDTAPSIDDIDVMPSGYSTTIYNKDGVVTQKLIGKDANRIYVTIDKIPKQVQNAFIAIEDARFWEHDGIDVRGIFRAFFKGISNGFRQGASTLTQQLLKNQVFNGGKETTQIARIQRKVQEQYLAIQLENKLDKKKILECYLNTINLGQNTLGVQAASKRYFNKNVDELTLSEASVIAGITQNPTEYNPLSNPEQNAEKRKIVLDYMKEQHYIDEAAYQEALADDVYSRIQLVNEENYSSSVTEVTSYFEDALFNQVLNDLKDKLGYTETQAYNALYRGGLEIFSTQDDHMQQICDDYLNDSANYPTDSKYSLTYRLSVMDATGKETHYSEQTMQNYFLKTEPSYTNYFTSKKTAKTYIKKYRKTIVKDDVKVTGESTTFTIQPQVSFVLMDQYTGEVKALVGGRGPKTASRTLNRAVDSLRQPGSTFKILSTYLPALDTSGMTLATVQKDEPYKYPGTNKQVRNWNGNSYRGWTTLRQAIYDSMNVVTVKTFEQVTPKTGYDYLINLGFTTIVDSMTDTSGKTYSDIQLATALGGLTNGVCNLELTGAFASIANNGIYTEPILYTKILDHDGNVLLERSPATRQVMKDSTASLLTSAMQDVVTKGTGTKVKFDASQMPVAGKTGTTTSDLDLWFVGYTPYLTAGIWGGYDQNEDQENTTYHKVLWKKIMEKITTEYAYPVKEFEMSPSVVSAKICPTSGLLATEKCPGRIEYFAKGSEPTDYCGKH